MIGMQHIFVMNRTDYTGYVRRIEMRQDIPMENMYRVEGSRRAIQIGPQRLSAEVEVQIPYEVMDRESIGQGIRRCYSSYDSVEVLLGYLQAKFKETEAFPYAVIGTGTVGEAIVQDMSEIFDGNSLMFNFNYSLQFLQYHDIIGAQPLLDEYQKRGGTEPLWDQFTHLHFGRVQKRQKSEAKELTIQLGQRILVRPEGE
jgi:hypothetical protein